METAQSYCGTKQPQAVLDVIRGNRELTKPTKTYAELKDEYDEALQEARARKLRLVQTEAQPTRQVELPQPAPTSFTPVTVPDSSGVSTSPTFIYPEGMARTRYLVEIAQALGNILPLVHYLASDECSPAERATVRDFIGTEAMFDLSTTINRLCSERANTQGK